MVQVQCIVGLHINKQNTHMKKKVETALPSDQAVVVVAGRYGKEIAEKYGIYSCQSDRKFRKTKYMAFYYDNAIEDYYEIIAGPFTPVDIYERLPLLRDTDYPLKWEAQWTEEARRLFVIGKREKLNPPIVNDVKSKSGRRIAYTRWHRYTTIENLKNKKFTSEL